MSSDRMAEQRERELAVAVAGELGISVDELDELEWEIHPHESNDGALYGYNVEFGEGSDPAFWRASLASWRAHVSGLDQSSSSRPN